VRVLIISYYFPPAGGPGVQRVLKFVRYLPDAGIVPHVLTAPASASYPVLDPSLESEIPRDVPVARSGIREFYGIYRRLAGRGRHGKVVNLTTAEAEEPGGRERILRAFRAAFFIPDGRMGWHGPAVRLGRRILRDHGIEVVFSSGPPFTAHWIARDLARAAGLPLVLDFRDPWTRAPFYPKRPSWARRLDEALERSCVEEAAAVVTVNREIHDDLRTRYPRMGRAWVIPNGFDPEDFAGVPSVVPEEFVLTHTGTVPDSGLPPALLEALRRLADEDEGFRRCFRLRLAGTVGPRVLRQVEGGWLSGRLDHRGYLPHAESVRLLRASSLLLLLIERERARGILTGKLFEYLASGTPILAIAPEGEAAALIEEARAGRVRRHDDVAGLHEALGSAWRAWRAGRRPFENPHAEVIARYSRPQQARALAAILRDAALTRRAGGSSPLPACSPPL
jgi:glycosyltransferase involved in cell wall biosynthesis